MNTEKDLANDEVKGLSRYIPTNLSKGILLVLPSIVWIVFSQIREHPEWFLIQSLTQLEQSLTALLAAILVASFFILVLVLDMAVAINHSKHRRIVHFSLEHPQMSFRFLVENANTRHWLSIGALCFICLLFGYLIGKA